MIMRITTHYNDYKESGENYHSSYHMQNVLMLDINKDDEMNRYNSNYNDNNNEMLMTNNNNNDNMNINIVTKINIVITMALSLSVITIKTMRIIIKMMIL